VTFNIHIIKFTVNFCNAQVDLKFITEYILATDIFSSAFYGTMTVSLLQGDDAQSAVGFNAYSLPLSPVFVHLALAHTALISYAYHYSMTNASAGEKIIKNAHPLWQP